MPFDSESQTASLLSIRNFSRKNLYLRVFLYFLIAYILFDLGIGLFDFLFGGGFHLLFSLASFFAIFNFYPTSGDFMDDYEALYWFLAGFFFVALFISGHFGYRLIDTMALIFPPSKEREKKYPCRVVVTKSRIEIHFNEHGTESMDNLVWKQDIFAVFLKMESNYQLRLCLVQDPNYHKTITEYDK